MPVRRVVAVIAAAAVLLGAGVVAAVLWPRDDPAEPPSAVEDCDDLGLLPCPRQRARIALPVAGTDLHLTYASGRDAGPVGLAGWSLRELDLLDRDAGVLHTGLGERHRVRPVGLDRGRAGVAARDGRTVTVFDQTGRPITVHDALTGVELRRFEWGEHGLASVVDRTGATLTVDRDATGVPVQLDHSAGPRTRLGVLDGFLAAVQYPGGGLVVVETARSGLVTAWSDPAGGITRYEYDEAGRLLARTDPAGTVTRYERHQDDRTLTVITTTPAGGQVRDTVELGTDGKVLRTHVAASGEVTTLESDGERRVLRTPDGGQLVLDPPPGPGWDWGAPATVTTTPDGRGLEISYDDARRVTGRVDSAGPAVSYGYDEQDRLVDLTLGSGARARTWRYSYQAGAVTIVDPTGASQRREFDAAGALVAVTGPGEFAVTLSRDAAGRLAGFAGPAGDSYRYTYRADGQLALASSPGGDGIGFSAYEYDEAGRMVSLSWADATADFSYDQADRLVAFDVGAGEWRADYSEGLERWAGPGATVAVERRGKLLTDRVEEPFDVTAGRVLDPRGLVVETRVGDASVPYEYDQTGRPVAAGNLTIERDPDSGAAVTERLGRLVRAWRYNEFGEPVEESVALDDGTELVRLAWERDDLGRVVSEIVSRAGVPATRTRYEYDETGRLAAMTRDGTRSAYRYDAAGNPRLERAGVRHRYDGAGRLAATIDGGRTTRYEYDRGGALLGVTSPEGPAIGYLTDAYGRRIARTVDGEVVSGLAYLDELRPAAELDAGGAVTVRYVYPDPSDPRATVPAYLNRDGADYLAVMDATGSPVLWLNAADGTVGDAVTRDPWGAVTSAQTPGFATIGFAGGITDPDTGLVRFGARDYDPAAGRWTAPDPLGLAGGAPGLYSYVGADPVNRTDPTGLICDYFQIGVHATGTGVLGGTGGVGIAIAYPERHGWLERLFRPVFPRQVGIYYTGGLSGGLQGGVAGQVGCQVRTGPRPTPPAISDLDGIGGGCEAAIGGVTGGVDGNTSADITGGHLGLGLGAGGGCGVSNTETVCLFGCPDPPAKRAEDHRRNVCEDRRSCELGSDDNFPYPVNDADITGDPHLRTAGGAYYDMHAVGEFVALAVESGELEVQTRQAPVPGSRTLAVNSAVAVRVDGTRFMAVPAGAAGLAVTVDGKLAGSGTYPLAGGGELRLAPEAVHADRPDGSGVSITRNPLGLDIGFRLADSMIGQVHGLVGPHTGQPSSQVEARDGKLFTVTDLTNRNVLYGHFADGWRVTDAESLFYYGPGESTETFTDPAFPAESEPQPPSPAERSAAEQICAHLGLPPEAVAGCVVDVVATGDAGFAAATATATRSVPGATPRERVPGGTGVADGDTVTGQIDSPGQVVSYELDLGGATVFWLHEVTGDIQAQLVGPDPGGAPGFTYTTLYGYRASATGRYTLEVSLGAGATGPYSFRLVTAKERRLRASVGDQIRGSIDQPGRVDLYELRVSGPTAVRLAGGTPCEAISLALVEDGDQPRAYTPTRPCAQLDLGTFQPGVTYLVAVWSDVGGTGDYAFRLEASG